MDGWMEGWKEGIGGPLAQKHYALSLLFWDVVYK